MQTATGRIAAEFFQFGFSQSDLFSPVADSGNGVVAPSPGQLLRRELHPLENETAQSYTATTQRRGRTLRLFHQLVRWRVSQVGLAGRM
jgi:hypothetical protein